MVWSGFYFTSLIILLMLSPFVAARHRQPKKDPPHIIVFMADDMGTFDTSRHGSEIRTPNLDSLMRNGVELQNYYVSPVCGPSRAQFLSGRYLTKLGLQHKNLSPCRAKGLPTHFPTIADYLKPFGYRSHVVGKWHAGFYTEQHLPTNRGFDSFHGMLNGMGDHYFHTNGYKGLTYLDWHNNTEPDISSVGIYSTNLIENRTIEIIRNHTQSLTNSTSTLPDPMFIFVSYQAPHTPLQAPDEYLDLYPNIRSSSRRKYAAMVTAMDSSIGRILFELQNSGLYNNSVIVFTSDNGGQAFSGASNWPYKGNKGNYYEGGLRSVGCISSPLLRRQGFYKGLFHITDWLPTFVHLAGSRSKLHSLDGIDQWDAVNLRSKPPRREILYNIDPLDMALERLLQTNRFSNWTSFNIRQLAAIRVGPWKLMTGWNPANYTLPNPATEPNAYDQASRRGSINPNVPLVQLFNIDDDPLERENLADEYVDIVQSLLNKLDQYAKNATTPVNPRKDPRCDPERNGGAWGPYVPLQST